MSNADIQIFTNEQFGSVRTLGEGDTEDLFHEGTFQILFAYSTFGAFIVEKDVSLTDFKENNLNARGNDVADSLESLQHLLSLEDNLLLFALVNVIAEIRKLSLNDPGDENLILVDEKNVVHSLENL